MAEASAFRNKAFSGDTAIRRTFFRQKTWLVVGLMTSAMLLMCTSVALLQRRFDLAGYFRHSPAAAAAAAEDSSRESATASAFASQRRIQELERELIDARGQTTSQFQLRTRLPQQLKSRRRVKAGKTRVKTTAKRPAAAFRDTLEGDTRRKLRGTTAIDISHELEILRGSFGERPLEIDAPGSREGRDSKHDPHETQVSTDSTLVARVDQGSSKGEPSKISVESQPGNSNTSQPAKTDVRTYVESESKTPHLKTTVSISDSTTSASEQFVKEKHRTLTLVAATVPSANHSGLNKHIRMLKRRRKLRIRVTPSKTHSSFSDETVTAGNNLSNENSAKSTGINKTKTKNEVYEAPHVFNDIKGELSSKMKPTSSSIRLASSTGAETPFDSVKQASPGKVLKINLKISPGNDITLLPLKKGNMTGLFQSQRPGTAEGRTSASLENLTETEASPNVEAENFTTYDKTLSSPEEHHINETSSLESATTNLSKNNAVKGISELFIDHSVLTPPDANVLVNFTPRNTTTTVTTMTVIVDTTVQSPSTAQNASALSPESSHDISSTQQPRSVPSTRSDLHNASKEQALLPRYNETPADANNLVDFAAEGANKTADDVLNKVLKKAMSEKREHAENLTSNRDAVSGVTSEIQENANGRVTWDDLTSNESSTQNVMSVTASYPSRADSRALTLTHTPGVPQSPSLLSRSTQLSTAEASAKETWTAHSTMEPPAKEAPTQESLEGSRTTNSLITTASTPQVPVEEVVPLGQAPPTGPPDEIIPEMESTSVSASSETTALQTTPTSPTFAYYTGKDEWIPGESVRFMGEASQYGKKLPGRFQRKAALSHEDLGNKEEWQASAGNSHRFEDVNEGDARYGDNSERLGNQERARDTGSNQPSVANPREEEAVGDLYSSLKSAVRDESKNRLSESNDETLDDGIQQPDSGFDGGFQRDHDHFPMGGVSTLKRSQSDGRGGTEAAADFAHVGKENLERASVHPNSVEYGHTKSSNDLHASPEPIIIAGSDDDLKAPSFERHSTTTKPESPTAALTLVIIGEKNSGITPSKYTAGNESMAELSPGVLKRMHEEEGSSFASFNAEPHQRISGESTFIFAEKRRLDENKTTLEDSTANPLKKNLGAAKDKLSEHPSEPGFIEYVRSDHTNAGKDQTVMKTEPNTFQQIFKLEGESPGVESEREIFTRTEETKPSTVQQQPPTTSVRFTRNAYPRNEENGVVWRSTVAETEDVVAGMDKKSSFVNEEITEKAKAETSAVPKRFYELAGATVGETTKTSRKAVSSTPDITRPGVPCVYRRSHAGWQSGNVSYSLESVPYEYCSSVLYCCLSLRQDLAIEDVDNNTDFNYLAKAKASHPGLETYVVIETNGSMRGIFQELLSKTVHQDIFVLLAVHWMKARKLGGAYIYWSHAEDKDGDELFRLYGYLHDSFNKSSLKFGVILPPGTQHFAKVSVLEALLQDLVGASGRVLLAPPEMEDSAFIGTISDHAELLAREYNRYPKSVAGTSPSVCPMIPFWGKSFKMQVVLQDTGLALKPTGRGTAGVVTQEPGKLAFFEFCRELGKSFFVFPTREHAMIGNEYMTFLTPVSLEKHLTSMVSQSSWRCFGSWGPEWDDFAGHCGMGRFPLLRTLYEFQTNRTLNVTAEFGTSEAGES